MYMERFILYVATWMEETAGVHLQKIASLCGKTLCMHGKLPNVGPSQTNDAVNQVVRNILPEKKKKNSKTLDCQEIKI